MKKLVLAGVSLFLATSVSASMFLDKSLPLRCIDAATKIKSIEEGQEQHICTQKLSGLFFEVAAQMIEINNHYEAKFYLDYELGELKMAKELQCNGMPVIDWAISEAQQIKQAL